MPLGPAPSGGSGGSGGGGSPKSASAGSLGPSPTAGAAKKNVNKSGDEKTWNPITAVKQEVRHMGEVLGLLGRPAEAVQAIGGATNLRTGEKDQSLLGIGRALKGEQYGFQGKGFGNTVANLGLDIVTDPTILLSGGTSKGAQFSSRLLAEAGAKELAEKAATKAGLSAAEKVTARDIIAKGIEEGGAGALTKRTLTEKAMGRMAGLTGEEIATERAMKGLTQTARGGVRVAGHTVLSGETIHQGGNLLRKIPAVGALDDAGKALFVPRAGVTKALGKPIADSLYGATSEAAGKLETHIGDRVRPLKDVIKANKITEAELRGPVLSHMENPAVVLEPRLQAVADILKEQRAATTAQIVDRKLLPAEFQHADDSFVHRATTDAGFKAIAKASRKGQLPEELAKVFKVAGSLEARKILPNATIPEAEAVVQGMLAKAGITMKKGETFFEHNPVKAVVSHGAAVERAAGQAGVLEHLASIPGLDAVKFVDSSTVKAPNLTEDINKAKSRVQTARRAIARTEGKLAAEGPARPRTGTIGGLEAHTLDPVERLRLTQLKLDQEEKYRQAINHVADLQDVKRAGGAANAAADAARKAPEGYEAIKVGERTAYVHPELAKEINGVKRLVDSNASVQRLTHHIDEVQNFWRAQVTVLPIGTGFFARNFQGNLILNSLDNVGVRDYVESLAIQKGVRAARKAGEEVEAHLTPERARIFREAEKHNVYNQGAQEADLNHVFPGEQVGSFKAHASPLTGKMNARDLPIIGTERGPIQAGRSLNAAIENNARLANFIANTRHSGHFGEAARRTRLTLFDYGDLTNFERSVGRRLVPFYTFARKSTGLLLRELAANPSKVNRITHILDAAGEASGYSVDSPLDAASKTLATPFIPGAAKNTLGVGGYLGAAKQQIIGTTIQDRESGGYATLDPGTGSESRLDMLANALLPEYGKYGRVNRAGQRVTGGKDGLLRLLLGLNPTDDPIARTPGGGQVVQRR